MTDIECSQEHKEEQVCSWCENRFRPIGPQRRPVCQRCYRVLTRAGFSEEKIFADDVPAAGPKSEPS